MEGVFVTGDYLECILVSAIVPNIYREDIVTVSETFKKPCIACKSSAPQQREFISKIFKKPWFVLTETLKQELKGVSLVPLDGRPNLQDLTSCVHE